MPEKNRRVTRSQRAELLAQLARDRSLHACSTVQVANSLPQRPANPSILSGAVRHSVNVRGPPSNNANADIGGVRGRPHQLNGGKLISGNRETTLESAGVDSVRSASTSVVLVDTGGAQRILEDGYTDSQQHDAVRASSASARCLLRTFESFQDEIIPTSEIERSAGHTIRHQTASCEVAFGRFDGVASSIDFECVEAGRSQNEGVETATIACVNSVTSITDRSPLTRSHDRELDSDNCENEAAGNTSCVNSCVYSAIGSDEGEDGLDTDEEYCDGADVAFDDHEDSYSDDDEKAVNADDELWRMSQNNDEIRAMKASGWKYGIQPDSTSAQEYPGLYKGYSGPSKAVVAVAESPIALFFYFLTKKLWERVAHESNRYHGQMIVQRAAKIQAHQKATRVVGGIVEVETKKAIRERLRGMKEIEPHELIVTLGLMLARMLCPHKRRLSYHWPMTSVGAIPRGTFGQFMARNRFDEIMRSLHFSNNKDISASNNRAWKIRPIVTALQPSFRRGFECPAVLSFDEGMLPSRSPFNGTRVYMKDKPHKWGTKLFVTCCAETSYCLRLEVYCGVKQHLGNGPHTIDVKSGPAAVLRNMKEVIPVGRPEHHLVVIDRFYTSVPLVLELLAKNVYLVGTIQTARIGFAANVIDTRKKRPKNVPRGEFRLAENKKVCSMKALSWMDSKPVHFLSTGASTKLLSVDRRLPGGEKAKVPCPKVVTDYHRWMGGVDVHDQLRLQRYSLQLAFVFKKYYKALFLGLVDMALVNAYIVYRENLKKTKRKTVLREEFLTILQEQMVSYTKEDFDAATPAADRPTPSPCQSPSGSTYQENIDTIHIPEECQDFYMAGNGEQKRRQRACKVCARWAKYNAERTTGGTRKRGYNTKWFCRKCSKGPNQEARCYLCNIVRPDGPHPNMTCHQVWHDSWACGEDIPFHLRGSKTQFRAPGKKRKRKNHDCDEDSVGTSARNDQE